VPGFDKATQYNDFKITIFLQILRLFAVLTPSQTSKLPQNDQIAVSIYYPQYEITQAGLEHFHQYGTLRAGQS